MKAVSVLFCLAWIAVLPETIQAGFCEYCTRSCSWYDGICHSRKATCVAAGIPFREWIGVVNSGCAFSGLSSSDAAKIRRAKDLLVRKGVFSRRALDRVRFRFCRVVKSRFGGADAITTSSSRVFFDDGQRSSRLNSFAALMAHEVKHTQQYSRWTYNGFSCRYAGQVAARKGTGYSNYVEKEAYDFSRAVKSCLDRGSSRC